jgi:hypothetical protein
MKTISRLMLLSFFAGAFTLSCEQLSVFDQITNPPNPEDTYYVQFLKASQNLETGVTEAGGLKEIETPIAIALMGIPQASPITIDLTIDAASTITPSMYTLSANSITIPAGKTSGSVILKTNAEEMPVGETLKFVARISAGEHNAPNSNANNLVYNLKRIEFCPLEGGIADMVGTWSGDDGGYEVSSIVTSVEGTKLKVAGIGEEFIVDFWWEEVVDGGEFLMTVTGNGLIDIPRQYIFTTLYDGDNYDYEIQGSGKWENCGPNPRIIFNYDIYYPGDSDGLAKSYGGVPYLTADLTMGGAAKSGIVVKNLLKESPRKR